MFQGPKRTSRPSVKNEAWMPAREKFAEGTPLPVPKRFRNLKLRKSAKRTSGGLPLSPPLIAALVIAVGGLFYLAYCVIQGRSVLH